jgi:spore germination cell wall hydrolase CwlJ-like protein
LTAHRTGKFLSALAHVAAFLAAAIVMMVTFAPASAADMTVALLTPVSLTETLAKGSDTKLTPELLAAYIERQNQLKTISFEVPTAAAELTEAMLLGYIAKRQNQALDAIEAVDQSNGPLLTTALLSTYAEDKFVPTAKLVKLADSERNCLAQAIYFESRGESRDGQLAVANVVINRAFSGKYPTTICGVVYQNADRGKYKCQFSFACDGLPDVGREQTAWRHSLALADDAFREFQRGERPGIVPNSVLFYHTAAVSPDWSTKFRRVAAIGAHVFYEN